MLCFSCWFAQGLFPGCDERTRLVLPKGVNTHGMSTRTTHILSPWLSETRVGVHTARASLCRVRKNKGVLWSGLGRVFLDLWWSGISGLFVGLSVFILSLMLPESEQHPWGASLLDTTTVYLSTLSVLSWPQAAEHIMRKGTPLNLSSGLANLHGWRQRQISWDAAAIVVGNFSSQIFEWDLGDECNLSLVLFLVISLFWLK